MEAKLSHKIENTVKFLVELLVDNRYQDIEDLTKGIRLDATQIRQAIDDYGRTLTRPPESEYSNLDVIEVQGTSPRKWSVRFDLWTEEEGRSDLSIELTLLDSGDDTLNVEIDNIHVL